MIPPRLKFVLLVSLVAAFVTMPLAPAQQRQRRVFTNDDISRTPPPAPTPAVAAGTPAAPAAPAATPAAAPDTSAAAATQDAPSAENLPFGLALAEYLQTVLRQYHEELSGKLDQEVSVVRQERWRTLMNQTIQFMAQNQLYIRELRAEQPQEAEAQPPSQSQPAP